MSKIQTYIECPNCGDNSCHNVFFHSTGEEESLCTLCGYSYRGYYEDEKYIEIENKNPYGIVRVKYDDGISQYISLSNKEALEEVINQLKEDITFEKVTFRTVESGQLIETDVL